MANRHNATQLFLVVDIIPLADKWSKHHRDRELHYRKEYEVAEQQLREKGFVMMEHSAILTSGAITGFGYAGKSLTPQLDQKYVENVNDAKNKVNEHKCKAEEYEKYSRAYRACVKQAPLYAINLSIDDMEFFHLDEL